MKNYLYIINKNNNKNYKETTGLINSLKNCEHNFSTYQDNDIECYFYTNENITIDKENTDYFFGFSGQLADTFAEIKNEIIKVGHGNEKKYLSKIAGANSISFYHKPSRIIEAYNNFSGVNPVFYCESTDRIVIGIDPLIVNCIAYNSEKPIFDLSNISSFLMMGYFFSHDTLFKGVKSIPHNTYISVEHHEVNIQNIDDSVETMFTQEPTQELYDDISEAYLKSLDVIPNSSKKLSVGLTGGKDSRLIALGLTEKQIEFNAITRGNEDHPDVRVAKLLADKLNLNHTVNQPVNKQVNEVKVDLVDKILKTMIGTSGLLYGYENIRYSSKYIGNVGITGVGAEAIRGGFGLTRAKEVDNISEFLLAHYYPYQEIILPEYREKYKNELIDIGSKSTSLRETGNKLFVEFYNGKRTGGARNALSYYNNSLSPFFDSNFLKQAMKMNIDEISEEKVHFNLMKNMNPEVAMLPFANDRWGFEKRGPLDPNDFDGWMQRKPVVSKTKRGGYNWRLFRNKDKTFTAAFKSLLLEDPTAEIYKVADYQKIKNIFDGPVSGNYNRVLWGLLSIKIYMEYFEKEKLPEMKLTLKLPPSTERSIQEPKVLELLNKINTLNDKLTIDSYNEYAVTVNQESKNYGYLIIGDGNLTKPSSNKLKETFAVDTSKKSISVRFCIDLFDEATEISLYTMYFDENGNRIHSKEYKQIVTKGINYLSKTLSIDKNAESVKFAIKIKSEATEPILKIKYGYMKYN